MGGILRRTEGRFTIEAAIIAPVAIAVLILLLHLGLILYQFLVVRNMVDYAATMAAKTWDINLEGFTGNEKDRSLYRRLSDSLAEQKKRMVEGFVIDGISRRSLLETNGTKASVELKNHLLCRTVTVEAGTHCSIPAGRLLKMFGLKSEIMITARAHSTVKDCAEFIRNTDLVYDVKDKLEDDFPGISEGMEKLTEMGQRIRDAVEELLFK